MGQSRYKLLVRRTAVAGLIALLALPITLLSTWATATAATPGSLYSYSLKNATATVANDAAANTNVPLNLQGNWTATSTGVQFTGDMVSKQSFGYAKPATGATLNVPSTSAIGASVLFTYQGPASGSCFSDSPNISQIGKFGTGLSQFKLQLSNCGKSSTNVFPQCRVAGSSSTTVSPVTGTLPLINGETYIVQCIKSADPATGNATMELKTANVSSTSTSNPIVNSFSVARTGSLSSSQYLSVANQYPANAIANNTDQFVGEISTIAYCTGADIAATRGCLETDVTAPVVEPEPATPFADEIHFAYGETNDEVVFNWRGTADTIYYGPTTTYGQQVTAAPSPITPWDIEGPFWEAHITGLNPDSTYHYKVGQDGADYTFRTKPTGDFTWVDIGDTKSSYCASWMPAQHALIAAQNPHFVTHGGDIGLLNECGIPSTHAYYTDQEVWSHGAAFQPAWGNHEYGNPTANSPAGTPRDSLANYKGRSWITNAQTVPVDTATRTSNPGCGEESGSTVNTCQGRDWGWFRTGNVVFISYPENWVSGWTDWQTKAGNIMAQAQADSTVDFIVTYGHRPPYTSSSEGPNTSIRSVLEALAATYSPTATNPTGKYVLNVAHHAHSQEAFQPIAGLTHIIDAAGGQGFTNFTNIDPNSVFRSMHFGILKADYNASAHTLTVNLVCGAEYTTVKDACNYGDTIYTTQFTRGTTNQPPTPAVLKTTLNDGVTQPQVGDTLTYDVTVKNDITSGATATGTNLSVVLPSNVNLTGTSTGATVSGNTATWNIGDVAANQTVSYQLTATLQSGQNGDQFTATATVTADSACANTGSVCVASDTDTVYAPTQPLFTEWVTNPGVETDLTGWTGKYGASNYVSVARDTTVGRTGSASIKVTGLTGANNLQSGINASPRWVTSATAGKTYTGSAWVKTQAAGQSVTLLLREWGPNNTLVGENKITVTPTSTNWFELNVPLIAQQNGTSIAFAVYGNDVDAGEYFYIDDLSLTSPL